MTRNSWIVLCLAYITGLLVTNLLDISGAEITAVQLFKAIALVGVIIAICAVATNQLRISLKTWLSAGLIAVLAIFYLHLRYPQAKTSDIVYRVNSDRPVIVAGKVLTEPRLNASQKLRFYLKAETINQKSTSGKVYVTLPLLLGTGINPGQKIAIQGLLYLPQGATIAGGFDFRAYLARRGIFTGMQGLEVIKYADAEPMWGWWKLRRRIVRSQLKGLGSPLGQMLSSMILGRKAVDLPLDIRDRFIEAGLAHVLAASGFHVSLLLGLVLKLTGSLTAKSRSLVGVAILMVYLGLTGIQASVVRACLMGCAVLLAMVLDTKVKSLGSLLLAATIILLFDPLAIADLGFQLSFLATFGLIVTLPPLQKRLDWLPPTIATLIAVPLAATLWVLPLLCYQFNVVATYSIVVNVLCTPLITVISLVGMISAIAASIFPLAGSAIAWLLQYPLKLLISIISFFTSLPGSSWAIGQIPLATLLIIYGSLLLVWLNPRWRDRTKEIFLFVLVLIIVPLAYKQLTLTQIVILPSPDEPAIVVRDRDRTISIGGGEAKTFQYGVMPFLNQQGINHLDYFVNLNAYKDRSNKVAEIEDRLSVDKTINNWQDFQAISTQTFKITGDRQNSLIKLETPDRIWLILSQQKPNVQQIETYIQQYNSANKPITLVCSSFSDRLWQLQPQTIITYNASPEKIQSPNFYSLKQDGAIAWTPKKGLHLFRDTTSNSIF